MGFTKKESTKQHFNLKKCSKVSFWGPVCWRLQWHGKLSWMIGKSLNLVILVKFPVCWRLPCHGKFPRMMAKSLNLVILVKFPVCWRLPFPRMIGKTLNLVILDKFQLPTLEDLETSLYFFSQIPFLS